MMMSRRVEGGCSGGWRSQFGNEYCFDTDELSHEDARDQCHDRNAQLCLSAVRLCVCVCHGRNAELASITSQDEDDYVADEMSVSDEIDESPKLQ